MGEVVGAPKDRARHSRASIPECKRLGNVELRMNGALRASHAMSDIGGQRRNGRP